MLSFVLFGGFLGVFVVYKHLCTENVSRYMLLNLVDDNFVPIVESLSGKSVNRVCMGLTTILNGDDIEEDLYYQDENMLFRYFANKFSSLHKRDMSE